MYAYSTTLYGRVSALTFHQFKGMESVITCYNNPSFETLPILHEVYGINMLITSIKHNYQVAGIADSLHYNAIAVKKVTNNEV
jgi:hypothetical protein